MNGNLYYVENGDAGLAEIDGYFYYARSSGALVIGEDYYVSKHNGLTHNGEEIK